MAARDVPYSSEGAEEELLDMRLSVVGFPTVEADTGRLDWDRWTLRGGLSADEGGWMYVWQRVLLSGYCFYWRPASILMVSLALPRRVKTADDIRGKLERLWECWKCGEWR